MGFWRRWRARVLARVRTPPEDWLGTSMTATSPVVLAFLMSFPIIQPTPPTTEMIQDDGERKERLDFGEETADKERKEAILETK